VSSDRQLGFKKGSSCAHAAFLVRHTIDHFVNNDSTVNIACVDISKAFDNVDHFIMFNKLIDRKLPIRVIMAIKDWYSKSVCSVKWGSCISESFKIFSGVRQGGILSPALFSIYVDDVLGKLNSYGCTMFGLCVGSFMYADDLILLAPSLCELQAMVNLCNREFNHIGLSINSSKSSCIRIGKAWKSNCVDIKLPSGKLQWASSIKYLGVDILAGKKFTICFDSSKSKFYSSFNSIYSKISKVKNPIVILNLISSIALPCLLYNTEALPLNITTAKELDHPWSRVFMRIFGTFNLNIIRQCQYFTGFLPLQHQLRLRKYNFITGLKNSKNVWLKTFYMGVKDIELTPIFTFYKLKSCNETVTKRLIWCRFGESLE
jgi:hypothetical protein